MKLIFALALLAILAALGSAGFFMLRKKNLPKPGEAPSPDKGTAMANALAWRVGLSIALFLFILLAWSQGWIQPHGVALSR